MVESGSEVRAAKGHRHGQTYIPPEGGANSQLGGRFRVGELVRRRFGKYEIVAATMRDFLAQSELGERLANWRPSN